jgi:hypothetical protein
MPSSFKNETIQVLNNSPQQTTLSNSNQPRTGIMQPIPLLKISQPGFAFILLPVNIWVVR